MFWIDLTLKLPPQDCPVLCVCYDDRPKTNMKSIEMAYRIQDEWFYCDDGKKIERKYGFITHWMPFPDLPGVIVENEKQDTKRYVLDFIKQTHLDIKCINERLEKIEKNKKEKKQND